MTHTSQALASSVYLKYLDFLNHSKPEYTERQAAYYLRRYAWLQNMANAMPCIVFMLNYATGKYPFMAGAFKHITGFDFDATNPGVQFAISRLHPDDAQVYLDVCFKKYLEYCRQSSDEQIANSRFSVNWRWLRSDNQYVQLLQQYVVLERDVNRNPVLMLGTITDISQYKTDNRVVFSIVRYDEKEGFKTIVYSGNNTIGHIVLTEREREVLALLVQGFSSKMIASQLSISQHTVNGHRRNLLSKTECANTADLCRYAVTNGLV